MKDAWIWVKLNIPERLAESVEILVTDLDESWTHQFQLRLTKVFKFWILTTLGIDKLFRNVY